MNKVLVVYGSPKGEGNGTSGALAKQFVQDYIINNPDDEIISVNPFEIGALDLTGTILAGKPTAEDLKILEKRQSIITMIKSVDKIVLATPMWDFSIPGTVKSYIDAWCQAGETFQYLPEPTQEGEVSEGLLNAKALFIQSMGGVHAGTDDDLAFKLVQKIFKFIGITDLTYVSAEAVDIPGVSTKDSAVAKLAEIAREW